MKLATITLAILLVGSTTVAFAGGNPAQSQMPMVQLPQGAGTDAVAGYTDHTAWALAAGITTLVDFEAFASGAAIDTELMPYGISMVTGLDRTGVPVQQYVTASGSLPFPMFTPGTLPSEPNFISNDLASPYYGTGWLTFELDHCATAIGAYVADGSPLDGFNIEVFDGDTSLGFITVPPRTLPDAFVGIVSDAAFTKATFFATSGTDSWGLDNVELNSFGASAVESSTWGGIKSLCR